MSSTPQGVDKPFLKILSLTVSIVVQFDFYRCRILSVNRHLHNIILQYSIGFMSGEGTDYSSQNVVTEAGYSSQFE